VTKEVSIRRRARRSRISSASRKHGVTPNLG